MEHWYAFIIYYILKKHLVASLNARNLITKTIPVIQDIQPKLCLSINLGNISK